MELQAIADTIQARFPGAVRSVETAHAGDPFLVVDPARIADLCSYLRDDGEMRFEWLLCLSGVDYPPESIAVVYHLYSQTHGRRLVLKVLLNRADPQVETVEGIWRMANWYEREVYDMFGVRFEGHSDLRRILLPFDWEGHPLRKDYVYPDSYRGITNKP